MCLGCDDLLIPYGLLISVPSENTTTLECIQKQSLFNDMQWACGFGRYVRKLKIKSGFKPNLF